MIDVDTLLAGMGECVGLDVHRWTFEEPPRESIRVPAGDELPALAGVRTSVSLLDITDPGYSLRNGHLVDPARRVVYEKKVVPLFAQLPVGLLPLEQPRHLRGSVACLSQFQNYGHWLCLALPLISFYREALGSDPDYYYVGSPVTQLHLETLDLLGVGPERIVGDAVAADRLLVAIADREEGCDEDFLLFANRALCPIGGEALPGDRRLFVSRAGASQRRVRNEKECAQALRETSGVELVVTDGMSLRDEIKLFRSAELVVGGHGAGLTNIAFAPTGARLVELASPTYWHSMFAEIAALKRQPHALVWGRPVGPSAGVPGTKHDYTVDVDRVVAAVAAALAA